MNTEANQMPLKREADVNVRIDASEKTLWQHCANLEGRSLSNWVRMICNKAATLKRDELSN